MNHTWTVFHRREAAPYILTSQTVSVKVHKCVLYCILYTCTAGSVNLPVNTKSGHIFPNEGAPSFQTFKRFSVHNFLPILCSLKQLFKNNTMGRCFFNDLNRKLCLTVMMAGIGYSKKSNLRKSKCQNDNILIIRFDVCFWVKRF